MSLFAAKLTRFSRQCWQELGYLRDGYGFEFSQRSGGNPLGTTTGAAAAAVDTRMLATLSVKDFAKSAALSSSVADCTDGCNLCYWLSSTAYVDCSDKRQWLKTSRMCIWLLTVSFVPETVCVRHSDCRLYSSSSSFNSKLTYRSIQT